MAPGWRTPKGGRVSANPGDGDTSTTHPGIQSRKNHVFSPRMPPEGIRSHGPFPGDPLGFHRGHPIRRPSGIPCRAHRIGVSEAFSPFGRVLIGLLMKNPAGSLLRGFLRGFVSRILGEGQAEEMFRDLKGVRIGILGKELFKFFLNEFFFTHDRSIRRVFCRGIGNWLPRRRGP